MKTLISLLLFLLSSLIAFGQKPKYEVVEMKGEVLSIASGVDFACGSLTVKVSEKDTIYMRFAQQYGELIIRHFKAGSFIEFKAKVNTNPRPKLSKEILFYFFQDDMLTVKLEGRWIELESEPRIYGKFPYKVFLDKKIKEVYWRENDKWALLMESNIIAFGSPFFIRQNGMKDIKSGDVVSFMGTEIPKKAGYVYPIWDAERVFSFIRLYKKEGIIRDTFIFWGVAHSAKSFSNLKRKNFTSVTPLKLALKPFILELKDSAFALVLLLSKKFRMLSK